MFIDCKVYQEDTKWCDYILNTDNIQLIEKVEKPDIYQVNLNLTSGQLVFKFPHVYEAREVYKAFCAVISGQDSQTPNIILTKLRIINNE